MTTPVSAHLAARAELAAAHAVQQPLLHAINNEIQILQERRRQLERAQEGVGAGLNVELDWLLLSPWTLDPSAPVPGWSGVMYRAPEQRYGRPPVVTLWVFGGARSGPAWGVTAERAAGGPALRRPLGSLAALSLEGALTAAEAVAREAGWTPQLRLSRLPEALAALPVEARHGLAWEEDERAPGAYWVFLAAGAPGTGKRARLEVERTNMVRMSLSYAHLRDLLPFTFPVYDLKIALQGAAAFLAAPEGTAELPGPP